MAYARSSAASFGVKRVGTECAVSEGQGVEVPARIELAFADLQSAASPLCDGDHDHPGVYHWGFHAFLMKPWLVRLAEPQRIDQCLKSLYSPLFFWPTPWRSSSVLPLEWHLALSSFGLSATPINQTTHSHWRCSETQLLLRVLFYSHPRTSRRVSDIWKLKIQFEKI
jgi:hypothetical protein